MGRRTISRASSGREAGKDEMAAWQTRHTRYRSKMATLAVAHVSLSVAALSDLQQTEPVKIATAVHVEVFEQLDSLDYLIIGARA